MRIIVTGSRGLIGQYVVEYYNKTFHNAVHNTHSCVIELDVTLGHDLTDEMFVRDFFRNQSNKADHLINLFAFNDHVAPNTKRGTLFDLSLKSFRECMEVNVTALFSVCREYARNNSEGNIINFAASTGIVSPRTDMYDGSHKHIGYSVSKAAVAHLTRILAVHLAPDIRVNCISPGGMVKDQEVSFKRVYGQHTPLERMGHVDELIPAIEMLCNNRNSYMTGANIVIDGGWTIV